MTNYVASYRRLDDNAKRDEDQADSYRQRAGENRWEQCRIAHEAVESGEYSRNSFAKAVNKDDSTIGRQYRIWGRWGSADAQNRPTYTEAWDEVTGDSADRRAASQAATNVRRMPAAEKAKLAAELLEDEEVAEQPQARHAVAKAEIAAQRREREHTERKRATDPVGRKMDEKIALLDLQKAINRFVREANELLPDVGPVPPDERHWVTGEAERLEAVTEQVRYLADHGETRTDAELRAMAGGS